MKNTLPVLLVALAGCQSNAAPPVAKKPVNPTPKPVQTALDRYIARPETVYKWQVAPAGQYQNGDGDFNLNLTSQTWRGSTWKHRLQVFVPKTLRYPDAALVNINFGDGSFIESFLGRQLADATGAYVVNLFDVPNQPLFERREDDLIAYTFGQFLKTGDETWPLLLPMTKSVTQAMNATQEWSTKGREVPIKRFVLSGGSKRGWTTYLGGAVDKRVVGLVPIVYNNLDLPAQARHIQQVWGKPSDSVRPYTEAGLFSQMNTARGKELIGSVDPAAYYARLTMPKLIVHASNDAYWPLSAADLYFDKLPGDNRLFNVPNAPHTLDNGFASVAGSAAAWGRLILDKKPIPSVALSSTKSGAGYEFAAKVVGSPDKVRLWFAASSTKDFRESEWSSIELQPRNGAYRASLSDEKLFGSGPFAGAWAEIEMAAQPLPLKISSTLWQGEKK